MLDTSNSTGMGSISCRGAETYLGAESMKHSVVETDGLGSQTDALSGHTDVPSIANDTLKPANEAETVSIHPTEPKPPDLPGQGTEWAPNEPNGFYSHADMLIGHGDAQSVQTDTKTNTNAPKSPNTMST